MAKKQWIKFKRGLFKDPKHRKAMGDGIWLYGDLIDCADWDTGIIEGFKDQEWADEMQVTKAWVRKYRRKLESAGYIKTEQHGPRGMTITINKWINPRAEGGTPVPLKGGTDRPLNGGTPVPPLMEGGTKGGTESGTPVTPSQVQNEHASILPVDHITTTTPNGVAIPADPIRANHPAIQAYRKATHRYPAKSWYDPIGQQVGEDETRVKRWGDLVFEWVGHGWNPGNVSGMLEAFNKGGLQTNGFKSQTNTPHPDKSTGEAPDPEMIEWARQVKEAEREAQNAA